MTHHSSSNVPKFDLSNRAICVTFSYQGQKICLVSRKILSIRTPPSDSLEIPEKQAGFWFQIEDEDGRLLYRRIMQNPIRLDTEIPSDNPERPLKRVPLDEPCGTFFLLLPFLREAHTVRIFSSPLESGQEAEPAREIMHFNIFEDVIDTQTQPPVSNEQQEKDKTSCKGSDQDNSQDRKEEEE